MYGPSEVDAAGNSSLPGDSAHSCACAKHFICLIRPSGGRPAAPCRPGGHPGTPVVPERGRHLAAVFEAGAADHRRIPVRLLRDQSTARTGA